MRESVFHNIFIDNNLEKMHSLFNYALFVFISLLISYEKHLLLWNGGICSVAALLRTSLGLRQQYKSRRAKAALFSAPRPYESKLSTGTVPKTNAALSCGACFCIALCGGGGIRTPGTLPFNSFQDCRHRPLGHTSGIADCKDKDKKLSGQKYLTIPRGRRTCTGRIQDTAPRPSRSCRQN